MQLLRNCQPNQTRPDLQSRRPSHAHGAALHSRGKTNKTLQKDREQRARWLRSGQGGPAHACRHRGCTGWGTLVWLIGHSSAPMVLNGYLLYNPVVHCNTQAHYHILVMFILPESLYQQANDICQGVLLRLY